jgi:hypothetical protein
LGDTAHSRCPHPPIDRIMKRGLLVEATFHFYVAEFLKSPFGFEVT